MTDPGTGPANLDPHGRPLGGQLERDARLLAAAQALDLTEGSCDNTTREYWYDRTRETYELLRRYGRDADVADFVTKAQNLQLITAQNDAVVEQVDAALGHRYHRLGVHFSVPHVAEKAAAELKELQGRIDAADPLLRRWSDDAHELEVRHQDDEAWQLRRCVRELRAALQGDQAGAEADHG